MTLARLLAAALVFCCLPVLAQDQQSQSFQSSTWLVEARAVGPNVVEGDAFFLEWKPAVEATPSEPWRIIPSQSPSFDSGSNPTAPARLDQYRLDQIKTSRRLLRLDALDADTTCYAIRSYVVARDSQDSDSTHPAGYSTCQPSNRYQVKSADLRVVSGDR
jgi:hypothetical protein